MISHQAGLYQDFDHPLLDLALEHNVKVKVSAHQLDFIKDDKIVRISLDHKAYLKDMILSFDYFFDAVESTEFNGKRLIDYSICKYHDVIGFDLMPVCFPSLAEPIITATQYFDFAQLKPGQSVLDLGAYSALTSIVFKELVGAGGTVLAVDADPKNIRAARKNLALYKKITSNSIQLVYGAVWNHNDGLEFSSEGNMGAAACEVVGTKRGDKILVPSFTLSSLAEQANLDRIDFIKCDIEGAEYFIFEDHSFFSKYQPRIIIETHQYNYQDVVGKCISDLAKYGYTCKQLLQFGSRFPLLECEPPISSFNSI